MDSVQHPLDWWAYGGHAEVMRNTGWSLPKARREVRKVIRAYGWNPIGRQGFDASRRRVMADNVFDHNLS